jgi:hypothetical protein
MTGNDSTSIAGLTWGKKPTVCWNCGGPHTIYDCKKEKNSSRIAEGKYKFNEEKALRESRNDRSNGGADRDIGGAWNPPPAQG